MKYGLFVLYLHWQGKFKFVLEQDFFLLSRMHQCREGSRNSIIFRNLTCPRLNRKISSYDLGLLKVFLLYKPIGT